MAAQHSPAVASVPIRGGKSPPASPSSAHPLPEALERLAWQGPHRIFYHGSQQRGGFVEPSPNWLQRSPLVHKAKKLHQSTIAEVCASGDLSQTDYARSSGRFVHGRRVDAIVNGHLQDAGSPVHSPGPDMAFSVARREQIWAVKAHHAITPALHSKCPRFAPDAVEAEARLQRRRRQRGGVTGALRQWSSDATASSVSSSPRFAHEDSDGDGDASARDEPADEAGEDRSQPLVQGQRSNNDTAGSTRGWSLEFGTRDALAELASDHAAADASGAGAGVVIDVAGSIGVEAAAGSNSEALQPAAASAEVTAPNDLTPVSAPASNDAPSKTGAEAQEGARRIMGDFPGVLTHSMSPHLKRKLELYPVAMQGAQRLAMSTGGSDSVRSGKGQAAAHAEAVAEASAVEQRLGGAHGRAAHLAADAFGKGSAALSLGQHNGVHYDGDPLHSHHPANVREITSQCNCPHISRGTDAAFGCSSPLRFPAQHGSSLMRGMPVLESPHVNQPQVRVRAPARGELKEAGHRERGVWWSAEAVSGAGAVHSATEERFASPLALGRNLVHAPQAQYTANREPGADGVSGAEHSLSRAQGFGRPPSPRWRERRSKRSGRVQRIAEPVAPRSSLPSALRQALHVMESPHARDLADSTHNSSSGRRLALLRATGPPAESEFFRRGKSRFYDQPFESGQGLGRT